MSSSSRIALVTGGSRGIGRATVLALAGRGLDVIFTYRAEAAAAAEVVRLAEASGVRARAIALDTGEISAFPAFVEAVRGALEAWSASGLDVLVNNAGNSHHAPFGQVTEADFDALYRVHLKGVFFLTQALLPLIRDGGRIVNVSSGLTRFAMPGSSAYGSIKGAVEVLTRYMARELGARGIAANVVAPGAVETDFSGGMVRDNPDINRMVAQGTALGRAGLPDDIGPMIASLVGEESRWINGQRIEVSGGMAL